MSKTQPNISIIIVQYHAKEVLFNCIKSIIISSPKMAYEIIIIDNDEIGIIEKDLKKISSTIRYIKSPKNGGFGAGINLGAKHARGKYICMLNPDMLVVNNTIDRLYEFTNKQKNAGIISAVMLDKQSTMPEKLGGTILTPIKAIFAFSFINKLFPKNIIAKKFWVNNWDVKSAKQATSVPLGAAILKKSVFDEIGGFDENFFLYYEDFDLCNRVEEIGYKNYLYKNARIIHLGGKGGTEDVKNISDVIRKSRFYYFKKHFGIIPAILTEMILRISKYTVLFALIFAFSIFLLFYHLSSLMMFIGDQGFFYLSARDIFLTGHIPLVGITSSHTWLHQGPLWTYMLAMALWISHFNPVSGAFLTAGIGVITVWLVYKVGSEMFSQRIGLIASLLYATSPLTIFFARMPYHTSPIAPLTLLLFYFLYKWINGYRYGFPLIMLLLALLYNFETATFMLFPIVVLVLLYGIIKKTKWVKNIFNKKILLLSLLSLLIPMIPMFLYDIHHGYPQTLKFAEWVVYKIATVFGFPKLHPNAPGETYQSMLPFASSIVQRMIFLKSSLLSWIFLGLATFNLFLLNIRYIKKQKFIQQYSLLLLFFVFPACSYVAEKTNSDAYFIVFFPTLAFMFALGFDRLMQWKKLFYPTIILLLAFVLVNTVTLFQENFLMGTNGYGLTLPQRLAVSKQIIYESKGKEYNLHGRGDSSQYISFTMNYEYLVWWLGHGPVHTKVLLQFIIQETPTTIRLTKHI